MTRPRWHRIIPAAGTALAVEAAHALTRDDLVTAAVVTTAALTCGLATQAAWADAERERRRNRVQRAKVRRLQHDLLIWRRRARIWQAEADTVEHELDLALHRSDLGSTLAWIRSQPDTQGTAL